MLIILSYSKGRHWERGNSRGDMLGMGGGRGSGDSGAPLPGANSGAFGASGFPPQVHFWCTFSGPPIASNLNLNETSLIPKVIEFV